MNIKRNIIAWVAISFILMFVFDFFVGKTPADKTISFSDFLNKAETSQISEVRIQGSNIEGTFNDGSKFITFSPSYPNLVDLLRKNNVAIKVIPLETKGSVFLSLLLSWFPMLLLIGVWVFFIRQMQGGAGKAMGFGKSKAKLLNENLAKVTFSDVAGIDEAKEELYEIVEYLRNPKKFQALGGRIPKGCLLVGSPGTGKTLVARAVAGEAGVPFFNISGSDFVEMFVGVGASRVRDMFEQAKKHAPCIIFIDEIDAVGRHRGRGYGGGNDEREQTLNQLLVEMDGFEQQDSVIVIAATNRPDVLDKALLRPGRFDRQIEVPLPDIKGRTAILQVHVKKIVAAPGIDIEVIARGTPGFSGADLANLVNEAALLATRKNKKLVSTQELEEAKDKVIMGAERRSKVISDDEKKLTAYHEGGHAIVAVYCPESDPIHKATIIPRGSAGGAVFRLPEKDISYYTRERLEADIAVAMGGRVAEEIIFGRSKVTSGASSDIRQATSIARSMTRYWGMSDEVGTIFYGKEYDHYSSSFGGGSEYSSDIENTIDREVKKLVDSGYKRAKKILQDNLDKLHLLAKTLLEKETLTGQEIAELVGVKENKANKKAKNLEQLNKENHNENSN